MKRILAMILALVLCLGLCACGESQPTEEEVKDAIIQNDWIGSTVNEEGYETKFRVTFMNNYDAKLYRKYLGSGFDYTWEGTYEITDDQIIISDSLNDVDFFIDYTYEDGEIYLTLNDRGGFGEGEVERVPLTEDK